MTGSEGPTVALTTATAFLLFGQIFMVAPLVSTLARDFSASPGLVALGVPAFLVTYGFMVLLWGTLSDHWGRRRVILGSLVIFVALVAITPLVRNAGEFIVLRFLTGVGAGGVVPIGVALVGDLVPYQGRGRVVVAQAAVIALSLGFDMTQPPLVGIVTDLPGNRGQAIGLKSCVLWVGMGIGSLAFQAIMLPWGFSVAFGAFGTLALVSAVIAVPLFRAERPHNAVPVPGGLS